MAITDQEFNARREAALAKLELAASIWSQFVTGPASLRIPIQGGTIQTLAGLIEDLRDEHDEEFGPLLSTIAEAVTAVTVESLSGPITTPP